MSICKKYSEIDFNNYEVIRGPFYDCSFCTDCESLSSRTNWADSYSSSCECTINSSQCYNSSACGTINKTDHINIPINPYIYPSSKETSPSESGKLCLDQYGFTPTVRMSNKIKITIPYDSIFGGTYVFEKCSVYGWFLNSGETSTSINTCINTGSPSATPEYLIDFSEINNPSDINQCYTETLITYNYDGSPDSSYGEIYVFPAKYYLCITQPAATSDDLGHRLSVGFTLPIRYRERCQDWILVDRLYNASGEKTPHNLFGSPNYAYLQQPLNSADWMPKYTFLNDDGSTQCPSGLKDLGFSFRCDGYGLGRGCSNMCNYPYSNLQDSLVSIDETSWFRPKIPVLAQVEFVYDCRLECICNFISDYSSISSWNNDATSCYGSLVNINYDCTNNIIEPNFSGKDVEIYFLLSSEYTFYIRHLGANYSTPKFINNELIIKKMIQYPHIFNDTDINSIISWINSNVSVINNQNMEKINAVDFYWDTSNLIYKLYIIPSED
jgi:hypothetical protein